MFDLKELLSFETMLAPKIITILYWILLAATLLGSIRAIAFLGIILGVVSTAITLVFIRISFELIMLAFKNNEYLKKIAAKQ